jgi:hypothetical protein
MSVEIKLIISELPTALQRSWRAQGLSQLSRVNSFQTVLRLPDLLNEKKIV